MKNDDDEDQSCPVLDQYSLSKKRTYVMRAVKKTFDLWIIAVPKNFVCQGYGRQC